MGLTRERIITVLLVLALPLALQPGQAGAASTGPGFVTSCPILPADDVWHSDISALPLNSSNALWMATYAPPGSATHPDLGAYPYGMPVNVVTSSHRFAAVRFQYASESDKGPYPVGPDLRIEGTPHDGGDDHALTIDSTTCVLYEIWHARIARKPYTGGSGAIFNLRSDALRPAGWTSADAAGLPIVPGLLRYDEVLAGHIGHAIRFTLSQTQHSYVWPARHQAGVPGAQFAPMGSRVRLSASFDISHYSTQAQVVLTAMQHYGLFLADNGSNWFFQGEQDSRWPASLIAELKTIPAQQFEFVDESSLMLDPNSGQARQCGTPCP